LKKEEKTMTAGKGKKVEIKEIMYFDRPGRTNTDRMIEFVTGKIESLAIKHVMIAWSSGYTLRKFLEAADNLKLKLAITVVTNPKGGTMGGKSVSIDTATFEKFAQKGIKVCYLNDDLKLGEPMSPDPHQKQMRDMLLPWLPAHIDPLSLEVGTDLSILLMFSQGFRVCAGCLVLAVKRGLIPRGERVLCLGGMATAAVMQAGLTPRTCYVEELLSFERHSDWSFIPQASLKKMVAITV
jgi:hypothetical protein